MIDYRPSGRAPYAVRLAKVQPEDRVLDIGCFSGQIERYLLKNRCASYFGVDLNSSAIEFARRNSPHQNSSERFLVAPAEELPFPGDSFDKVFCLDTLEHVANEKQTIAEIYRVLKPGGTLILSVPHDFLNFLDPDELTRGARNIVRKYVRKKELLDHAKHRHYNEGQLRKLLDTFSIEHIHKSGTPIFWSLTMFYTAFGFPEKFTRPFRLITNPVEDFEYSLALPTGFNIMVRAKR